MYPIHVSSCEGRGGEGRGVEKRGEGRGGEAVMGGKWKCSLYVRMYVHVCTHAHVC